MAEVTFNRLGGEVQRANINETMTVREFLSKSDMKYKEGDDIRIQGKSVDLDTKITADQATLIMAVPKIKGGK